MSANRPTTTTNPSCMLQVLRTCYNEAMRMLQQCYGSATETLRAHYYYKTTRKIDSLQRRYGYGHATIANSNPCHLLQHSCYEYEHSTTMIWSRYNKVNCAADSRENIIIICVCYIIKLLINIINITVIDQPMQSNPRAKLVMRCHRRYYPFTAGWRPPEMSPVRVDTRK